MTPLAIRSRSSLNVFTLSPPPPHHRQSKIFLKVGDNLGIEHVANFLSQVWSSVGVEKYGRFLSIDGLTQG